MTCCQVTKDSFIDGGFFKTGDAARVNEDGYYVILGRKPPNFLKLSLEIYASSSICSGLHSYTSNTVVHTPVVR